MFGHMKAEPILNVIPKCSVEEAVRNLIEATEGAQAVRWLEFPTAVLLLLTISGDSQSGAFYVLDRRSNTCLWLDFEDDQYGGRSPRAPDSPGDESAIPTPSAGSRFCRA